MHEKDRDCGIAGSELSSQVDLADTTDSGRKPGEWRSKYEEPKAKKAIRVEAIYLGIHLFFVPIFILILWLRYPQHWLELSDQKFEPLLSTS